MFNKLPQLAWFHDNGEQAYRSINGKITFIIPTDKPTEVGDTELELPQLPSSEVDKFNNVSMIENYAHCLAYNIEARRNPEKAKLDIFGAIVSTTKDSLLRVYTTI